MSDPYVGEIRMFGGNFPPAQWAFCAGQTIGIDQNPALFNLIGTTYGGNGQTTFNLPDFRGRVPIHMGTGQGLGTYVLGQAAGTEQVTLTAQNLPSHNHSFVASLNSGNAPSANNAYVAAASAGSTYIADPAVAPMSPSAIANSGSSLPHDNLMPYLCVSFIISLFGIYPSQN